jgi:hypothetical protein
LWPCHFTLKWYLIKAKGRIMEIPKIFHHDKHLVLKKNPPKKKKKTKTKTKSFKIP